jgi:hypothetical protein
MSSIERYEIELKSGRVLLQLSNEDRLYGFLAVDTDGRWRLWHQTWWNEYAPTQDVFPGFVSAARAVVAGYV